MPLPTLSQIPVYTDLFDMLAEESVQVNDFSKDETHHDVLVVVAKAPPKNVHATGMGGVIPDTNAHPY